MAEQNNEQRGVVGALLAMVAGLLLLIPWPSISSSSSRLRSAEADTPALETGGDSSLPNEREPPKRDDSQTKGIDELLSGYLGVGSASEPKRNPACGTDTESREQSLELKALVMCVADPIFSSNGYRTDLQVESLQKALTERDYVADRWFLPWKSGAQQPCANQPGAILFRGPDNHGRRQLLVVYVVGELMTSGVNRTSLTAALDHAHALLRLSTPRQTVIPILGPVFTGSAESLGLTLAAPRKAGNDIPVVVLNFSATAFDVDRFERLVEGTSTSYAATIASFDEQREKLLKYALDRLGVVRVAWLTEAGTGLAAGTRRPKKNQAVIWNFVFPTGIAQVRDAYDKDAARNTISHLASPADRTVLRFPAEAQSNARDLLPRFSPRMQGPYTELSLRHLLLDIARDEFDAVGITATDHRDRLFLVDQVRKHVPEAQILLVGGDLAFEHPMFRQAMLGSLVVSAYPPFIAHHLWLTDDQTPASRLALPTQANYALFNAIALGLDMAGRRDANYRGVIQEYHLEKAPEDAGFRHYDSPICGGVTSAASKRPRIWISAVGYQGAWPLEQYELPAESKVVRLQTADSSEGSGAGQGGKQSARLALPGIHVSPVPLTQLTVIFLVLALLSSIAIRGGFETTGTDGETNLRAAADEWLRPLADWWNLPRGALPGEHVRGRSWRLGGPLTVTVAALWLPATAVAAVALTGLIAGENPTWEGGIRGIAKLHASWSLAWFVIGTFLLAPWRIPRLLRLLFVLVFLAGCIFAGEPRLLLPVTILAATASTHLAASLVRIAVQAWSRRAAGEYADYWLTAGSSILSVGLLIACASQFGISSYRLPWLLTTAWVFNGISPLLPLSAAGLGLASMWYAELLRSWRADEYPIRSSLGSRHAVMEEDRRELETIRYPLLGYHAIEWIRNQLHWSPAYGSRVSVQSPIGVLQFIFLVATSTWLVTLAMRLTAIYPDPRVHWGCVTFVMVAFLTWALLLVRTQTLIDLLFDRLSAFRREVDTPGTRLEEAFKELHRPKDVALGRMLYSRRPPLPSLDDIGAMFEPTDGPPQSDLRRVAACKRVIGIKRFVRSLGGQIRWLSAGLIVGAILLFIASTSIPCQPRSALLLTSTLSFIAFAWVSVSTLVRIERDPVLNLIANLKGPRVAWDVQTIVRIAVPVAIPLLLVLGQAFPDAWQWVGALVEGWRGS